MGLQTYGGLNSTMTHLGLVALPEEWWDGLPDERDESDRDGEKSSYHNESGDHS